MKLGIKERFVTGIGLGSVCIIAGMIAWTYSEVGEANRERNAITEIARELTEVRLATFEYSLHRKPLALAEWNAASDRVDRLLAAAGSAEPAQVEILAGVRENRTASRLVFAKLAAARRAAHPDAPSDDASTEAHLFSRLLAHQQENFTGTLRLGDLTTERISDAQRRMMIVTVAGLALIAATMIAASWFLRRGVLGPIAELQRATREVAGGDYDFSLALRRDDEIGELSKQFDAMTESLRRSFTRIRHSNRDLAALNEELEAFSYSVSHDLRAPLRGMDGFSMVLLEDYGDKLDDEGKDALNRIRAASQRMGRLIDDLLQLSRAARAELHFARVDLSAISREIADDLQRAEPHRSVEWAIEAGLSVCADPALMRIAMQNLLQNAWKFTSATRHPVIRVGVLKNDTGSVHFVADNGAGFDMAHADRLFGAFQRLHHTNEFPGDGIGLAIVRRIIGRHHGDIRAEAKAGEGATFFFNVERSESASDAKDNSAG